MYGSAVLARGRADRFGNLVSGHGARKADVRRGSGDTVRRGLRDPRAVVPGPVLLPAVRACPQFLLPRLVSRKSLATLRAFALRTGVAASIVACRGFCRVR